MEIHALISCYACKEILTDEGYEVTYPDGYLYTVCKSCLEGSLCNWCGEAMKKGLWESHKCIEPEESNADLPTLT